jgi:predicted phosphodiesterase
MRILVLSDLHANATSLDAVLDAAQGRWDRSVCLGDVVGYGPDPNEVTARMRELGTQTIRGNHDKAVAGLMNTEDFNPVAKAAVDWTRAELDADHLEWLRALPHGPFETEGLVLVHGAFQDEDEYVFNTAQALRIIKVDFRIRIHNWKSCRFIRVPRSLSRPCVSKLRDVTC